MIDPTVLIPKDQEGLIPRTIRQMFNLIKKEEISEGKNYTVYCSFIQIYNERIYDLLQDVETKKPLKIRED